MFAKLKALIFPKATQRAERQKAWEANKLWENNLMRDGWRELYHHQPPEHCLLETRRYGEEMSHIIVKSDIHPMTNTIGLFWREVPINRIKPIELGRGPILEASSTAADS